MAETSMPTRRLTLMRHGQAALAPPRATDHQRQLTEVGVRQTRALGKQLALERLLPDLVISSDAERAVLTARNLLAGAGETRPLLLLSDLYDCNSDEFLAIVEEVADYSAAHVLVVGHNPSIAIVAEQLATQSAGSGRVFDDFAPGTAVTFTVQSEGWQRLGPSSVRLERVHQPTEGT